LSTEADVHDTLPDTEDFRTGDLVAKIEKYKGGRGGARRAGTLASGPLRAIEGYLRYHFAGRSIKTVETGCGASTILFSRYAERHLAFCYDDRNEDNSSVDFATSFPGFNADAVEWIFGPTQRTIFSRPLQDPVDLILIDGPHGYPFPELEYFAFYPWVKPGGILIVGDIHIPTITNFYRFLCEDEMFLPHKVVDTTAFFIRSEAPPFTREGDDWWLQRYNVQRLLAYDANGLKSAFRLPFSIAYTGGRLARLGHHFQRGFILVDGQPVTDGGIAMMRLPLDQPLSGKTIVEIDVKCVATDQQPDATFEAFVNLVPLPARRFGEGRQRLLITLDAGNSPAIDIKFDLHGLKTADRIDGFASRSFDKRKPGLILQRIAIRPVSQVLAMLAEDITMREGGIVSFRCESNPIRFFVDHPEDSVQLYHQAGQFYEWEELNMLRRHVEPGVSVLDVGANIGNHTVFFEKILGASKVIPIEPISRAIDLLRLNVSLNRLMRTDLGYLGVAFGAATGMGTAYVADPVNLGGATVLPQATGDIPIEPGDWVIQGHDFGLIKIDVEGDEMEVLEGLSETIGRCKPVLFIEVWDKNHERAEALIAKWGYRVVDEYRRYNMMTNLVCKRNAL
jgi:FkbM family methyltransferase